MDWGATWLSCLVPLSCGNRRETVLRCATFEDHLSHRAYLGATIGRYANRIKDGRFESDAKQITLSRNHFTNTLHGGNRGFDQHTWHAEQDDDTAVIFSRQSPNGEQGFPGVLDVKASYRITEDNKLVATYEAITDQRTPINLTNHAYFNLSTDETILDHHLMIDAEYWLPVDEQGIPIDGLQSISGTHNDFRSGSTFHDGDGEVIAYDHSYLLRANQTPRMKKVARLSSPTNDLSLEISTDKPALQLYTGEHLAGLPGRAGRSLKQFAGVALETQFLPDSPNHPDWPHESAFLDPGHKYRYQTTFRFIP